MNNKLLYVTTTMVLAAAFLSGCGEKTAKTEDADAVIEVSDQDQKEDTVLGGNIGISFPSEENKEQQEEAEEIANELEERGYEVQVAYGGDDGSKQAEQIGQMIEDKVNCLIIMPVDSEQLQDVMKQADKQGIVTVAYDSLITGTDKLSYYVGFDDLSSGEELGDYLIDTMELEKAEKEGDSYTIEFFMGALNDRNNALQLEGIMNKLEKYLKKGTLNCKSLRLTYEDVSIPKGSREIGTKTCENILKANYMDEPLNIICAGEDKLVPGILAALEETGVEKADMPFISAMGNEEETFRQIHNGLQHVQIYEYRSELPSLCVEVVDKEIQGEEIKDMGSCDNGTGKIPSVFGKTDLVTEGNYRSVIEKEEIQLIEEQAGDDDEQ